jgi:Zn-dependent peptidase ImmA (M78 family)
MAVSVGGHRYSDPDVLSLIYSGSGLLDPRVEVIRRAGDLNEQLRSFPAIKDPRTRIEILASLAGVKVLPMSNSPAPAQNREALLFRNAGGNTHAFYDPTLSAGRANFSIAHEIVHTFFPNSVYGARFRSLHIDDSREATELERLCHLGASELLMPHEEFLEERGEEFGLKDIPHLAERFGSSYEATVYRIATTHPSLAVAGRLKYRLRMSEERQMQDEKQKQLFSASDLVAEKPSGKYRRQSLHSSTVCRSSHWIPWNKSFDETSCVYRAATTQDVVRGIESLPNQAAESGSIECVQAPYQYPSSDPDFPDVLFLWWKHPH